MRVSVTTGLMKDWEAAMEEAFASEGGTNGRRHRLLGHGSSRERRRRRRWQMMLGVDAGKTEEKRQLENMEIRHRWLGLYSVEKEKEEKEEAKVDGCDSQLEKVGHRLMKTETRPTAMEKCEGHEDPLVVGDGKDEEGEREIVATTKFAEDLATASRRRKALGFAVMTVKEEKAMVDGEGRERRDRGVTGEREGEEGGSRSQG